jgi:catechol 2,3-dioxygenase-like lactoylglutathione lyase family enzyme
MFRETKAFSGFAVPDIAAAKASYGDSLGIDVTWGSPRGAGEDHGMLALHLAGGRDTIVYPKSDHVPPTYTILNVPVDDIEAAVDALTEKGVEFQKYEGEDLATDGKGIMRQGGPLITWSTDPADILSVLQP